MERGSRSYSMKFVCAIDKMTVRTSRDEDARTESGDRKSEWETCVTGFAFKSDE